MIEETIQSIGSYIQEIKHLPGQHNNLTHGDRFGHVAGQRGKVQVRVGGGAPGHNVVRRNASGKPTKVRLQSGKVVSASSPKVPHVAKPKPGTKPGSASASGIHGAATTHPKKVRKRHGIHTKPKKVLKHPKKRHHKYILEQDIQSIIFAVEELKHLPGRHDQRTHGNRFGHVDGLGKVQVRIGGGAPGRNVEKWDDNGNPLLAAMGAGKKPKKVSIPKEKPVEHITVKGKELSQEDVLSILEKLDLIGDEGGQYSKLMKTGDTLLGEVYKKQGFDGKPDVSSDAELDASIADGDREGYRGIAKAKQNGYHLAYENGEYFPGKGIYGNGTYIAATKNNNSKSAKDTAENYADSGVSGTGIVMRMAIKKDAKMGDYETLDTEATKLAKKLSDETQAIYKKISASKIQSEKDALTKELFHKDALMQFYMDTGRYAASKGYDGYYISDPSSKHEFTVILNRTATRVSINYMEV